jgi:hypothetical protein
LPLFSWSRHLDLDDPHIKRVLGDLEAMKGNDDMEDEYKAIMESMDIAKPREV